jgi:hypothetical protein
MEGLKRERRSRVLFSREYDGTTAGARRATRQLDWLPQVSAAPEKKSGDRGASTTEVDEAGSKITKNWCESGRPILKQAGAARLFVSY